MLKKEHVDLILKWTGDDITKHVAPPVDCEICGHPMPTHADAMNIALAVQVGVPGHPAIAVIQCPMPEHWACSIDCWRKMADRCLDEHIIPLINVAHDRVKRQKPVARRKQS